MSYRHTIEAALESLHEMEDLLRGFPENAKIPEVEIDLALQKLRNLYELMLIMKKPVVEPAAARVITVKEEKAIVTETIEATKTQKTVTVKDDPQAPSISVTPAATTHIASTRATREVQTLADQFKGSTTLHESFHQKTNSKEGDLLRNTRPVSDLMTVIGINDRFTFITELFNNNASEFEASIKSLNEAPNFNDAYNFMIQQYNWDMDSEPVQMLLDIIRRKFITGRHE